MAARGSPHTFLDVQNLVSTAQLFLHQHRVQWRHGYDPPKNIIFHLAKLVLDGKMFGKGDGFLDFAETPSQRDFHAMMSYDYRQGKSFQQSFHSVLSNCFGDQSPSRYLHNWYKEFQFGRTTFEDSDSDRCCSRPVTVDTEQNVATLRCLITEDPRITDSEIKGTFNLSSAPA